MPLSLHWKSFPRILTRATAPTMLMLLILALLPKIAWAQAGARAGIGLPIQSYLYVVTPGIRDYLEYGGAGILVFDVKKNYEFVKRIETPASKTEKPRNIKGVCANALTGRLYFSTPEKLYCVDLNTDETLWEIAPQKGCDRMSLTPDGKVLYVPSFEKEVWYVIDAMTGNIMKELETNSGSHNTVVSRDGQRMYLGGLKSNYLFVADTTQHRLLDKVGPFSGAIRPFTVNALRTRAYICVNDLLGFEIGDLTTGQKLERVEVAGFPKGTVKRHGCPSHGIGLTPDEREVWVVDAANQQVHVFDIAVDSPRQIKSIALREQPGWVTFSMQGHHAYLSTGEIIDTRSKEIVARLTDEQGREVHSEKMVEIHKCGQRIISVGDQFGVGRSLVQYQPDKESGGRSSAATISPDLPFLLTPQCYSRARNENHFTDDQLVEQALHEPQPLPFPAHSRSDASSNP